MAPLTEARRASSTRRKVAALVVEGNDWARAAMRLLRREGWSFYIGGEDAWMAQYRGGPKARKRELDVTDWGLIVDRLDRAIEALSWARAHARNARARAETR